MIKYNFDKLIKSTEVLKTCLLYWGGLVKEGGTQGVKIALQIAYTYLKIWDDDVKTHSLNVWFRLLGREVARILLISFPVLTSSLFNDK